MGKDPPRIQVGRDWWCSMNRWCSLLCWSLWWFRGWFLQAGISKDAREHALLAYTNPGRFGRFGGGSREESCRITSCSWFELVASWTTLAACTLAACMPFSVSLLSLKWCLEHCLFVFLVSIFPCYCFGSLHLCGYHCFGILSMLGDFVLQLLQPAHCPSAASICSPSAACTLPTAACISLCVFVLPWGGGVFLKVALVWPI